ncbi:MAG: toprim domain-containing protein, partial [Phycisphaerales bacterium]|nr:toprim domain-containing protein [Phycisphaerales bacterium]
AFGKTIAFGARRINEEDEPKYLNSPETELFHKSKTLYGMHLAQKSIRDEKLAIVVEGYTDVIACHQAGVEHVVGTLGTAFTKEHATMLSCF